MANVDMTTGNAKEVPAVRAGETVMLQKIVDWADAATEKGSALATNDLIQIFDVPIASWVITGIIHARIAPPSACATLTLHLGYTSDDDEWCASYDGTDTTSVGTAIDSSIWFGAADTVDIDLAAVSAASSLTSGEVAANIYLRPLYAGMLSSNK